MLFAISVLVFVIFNVIPGGDPALRLAGRHPTQENIRQIRKDWGFDQPLYVQYGKMMERLFIKRDLISYQDQTPGDPDDQARHPAHPLARDRGGAHLARHRHRDRRRCRPSTRGAGSTAS